MKIKILSYIKLIDVKEFDLGKKFFFVIVICIFFVDVEGIIVMELDVEWYGGGYFMCEICLDL